ncbi:MAG: hypothetical protein IKV26_04495 [Paludibacteraceae bacterium]|nr:hypothetical protein [Paludibacteraceae bacterium]
MPIFLRDSASRSRDDNAIIDPLGAYFSNRKSDSAYIELYLSNIDDEAKNDEHFKWLFTKVLIHELAHATMDVWDEKVSYHTEFGRWREESMANAIALRIIKEYADQDFYDYAKIFMQSQPAEYALGVLMVDLEYWDFSDVVRSKYHGVNLDLQKEWLNYVKGSPNLDGLKTWNDLLSRADVYYFQCKYYTSEEDLVYDIVNEVLSDYEANNGENMDYAKFSSLFPCIEMSEDEMSYEPANKVEGNDSYETKIELKDGDYYLYDCWTNKELHEFIKNVKVDLKEFTNW